MAQSPPPISPTVATPLAHRKRRHSAIDTSVIDITQDDEESRSPVAQRQKLDGEIEASGPTATVVRKLEDQDEIDEDDKELLEDVLDTVELEPYKPGTYHSNQNTRTILHTDIQQVSMRVKKG